MLHLFACLYYLYQWCTVKQISDNEIYLLFKYIKSVLWRVAKRLSYIEDARRLKFKLLAIWYYHTTSGWSVCVAAGTMVLILQQAFPKQWLKLKYISSSCQARGDLRNKERNSGGSGEQDRPFGNLWVDWIIIFTQILCCTQTLYFPTNEHKL